MHVTEDLERGVALLRGRGVKRILETAGCLATAKWSPAGAGFVVPASSLPDIAAAADYLSAPYRCKTIGGAA